MSPPKEIKAEVDVQGDENWSTLKISKIRYTDESQVIVEKFLGIVFNSPKKVSEGKVNASTTPWVDFTPEFNSDLDKNNTFDVSGKLNLAQAHPFVDNDNITFAVAGDLHNYKRSVRLWADYLPDNSGTVNVYCGPKPDSALPADRQGLTFARDERSYEKTVPFDKNTPVQVPRGTYAVTAAELITKEETIVATTKVVPDSVNVETGKKTDVTVGYEVTKYSAMDVTIENILGLENEEFYVRLVYGKLTHGFLSPSNHTTPVRRILPQSGTVDIQIDSMTLNNVESTFRIKNEKLLGSLSRVRFSDSDVTRAPVITQGFVKLPIVVKKEDSLSTATIHVHLLSSATPRFIYTEEVKNQAGRYQFSVPVRPGEYTVQMNKFIDKGIIYAVNTHTTLTVEKNGTTTLDLTVTRGADLNVRGFPSFLSFGGCTDLRPGDKADFVAARASSIFKYAGKEGGGDPLGYLEEKDEPTSAAINFAHDVGEKIGGSHKVLPVMISYTCNLSGGDVKTRFEDGPGLKHSFGNLILSLQLAMKSKVRVGYILNPDFIGECQKSNPRLPPDYKVEFVEQLQAALKYRGETAEVPRSITTGSARNTLRSYVLAVNWLVRAIGKDTVTFGWQVNLWGGEQSGSVWIYRDEDEAATMAKNTVDYVKKLGVFELPPVEPGVFEGADPPDFLAVDRYERDDFTTACYANKYCFAPREWRRYFEFCEVLSAELKVPVMPWQISASHLPLVNDDVKPDFATSQHWGTGGSYILGHPEINSNYRNINRQILDLKLDNNVMHAKTVEELFRRSEPFDLTNPAYGDFPLRGIFAVLLGGGSTTGIVSSIGDPTPWARDKLKKYMDSPISFQTSKTLRN